MKLLLLLPQIVLKKHLATKGVSSFSLECSHLDGMHAMSSKLLGMVRLQHSVKVGATIGKLSVKLVSAKVAFLS